METPSKSVGPELHCVAPCLACLINVHTDKSSFRAMYFAFHDQDHKEPSMFKLIVVGEEEKVVGVHILGQGCDEAMQGFGVAVKMGGKGSHA
jgi:pyruvate/2-oxoglutarate dehydrogenase complex dihydrolipoamide dehydrogenase (E3) component